MTPNLRLVQSISNNFPVSFPYRSALTLPPPISFPLIFLCRLSFLYAFGVKFGHEKLTGQGTFGSNPSTEMARIHRRSIPRSQTQWMGSIHRRRSTIIFRKRISQFRLRTRKGHLPIPNLPTTNQYISGISCEMNR